MDNTSIQDAQLKLKYSIFNTGGENIRKNSFSLADYNWFNADESEKLNIANDISYEATLTTMGDQIGSNYLKDILLNNTPYIRVTEFQPNNTLTYNLKLLTDIYNTAKSMFTGSSLSQIIDRIREQFSGITADGFSKQIIEQLLKTAKNNNAILTTGNANSVDSVLDIPYALYKLLISGKYTGLYDIPFYNNNTYLHNKASQDGWKSNTLRSSLFGEFEETLKNIPGLNTIDIAGKPKWSLENGGAAYDTFSCEFYLYNNSFSALMSNFIFINTLLPNSMWLQNGLLQHPATLYDVEIPGRTRLFFCKATIMTEFMGKVRRPPDKFYDMLSLKYCSNSEVFTTHRLQLNKNAVFNVPDVYKIKIDFTSMLPNNFNTYLYYMVSDKKPAVGESNIDLNKVLLDATNNTINEIMARNTQDDSAMDYDTRPR